MVILYFIFAAIRYLSNLITYIRGISRREVLWSGRASTAWKCVRTPPWGRVLRIFPGCVLWQDKKRGKGNHGVVVFLALFLRGCVDPEYLSRKGKVWLYILSLLRFGI